MAWPKQLSLHISILFTVLILLPIMIAILLLFTLPTLSLAQNGKPYYPHLNPWGDSGRNGDRIAVKRWHDYGCTREDSVLGQEELQSGHCKNYRHPFESLMWELWPRPKNPDRNDETIWNCSLSVFERQECEGKNLVTFGDGEASTGKEVRCLGASDPTDTDRVGHSLFLKCNGATGYSLAIPKPFCIDPRITPGGGKGLLASFYDLNLDRWDHYNAMFWRTMDIECKVEPFLDVLYNTSEYWNAKKHHESDPYWWLKVHEWRHLNGCRMWTSMMLNGMCNTPGTIVDPCGMTTPAWPAWLPWRKGGGEGKEGEGGWQPPLLNSYIKYPPWPNTGYKACLKAYGEWQNDKAGQGRAGGPSVVASWSGPPYYRTVYGSTLDYGSATAVVSGVTRTRMYPYLKPTVVTVWTREDERTVQTEGWAKGTSTWAHPGLSATRSMDQWTNSAMRTMDAVKTRFSTVWLPQETASVVVWNTPGTVVRTQSDGEKYLSEGTWSQTFTVVNGKVTTVGEDGPLVLSTVRSTAAAVAGP